MQLALWRLRYPKELSGRAKECYLNFLKKSRKGICSINLGAKQTDRRNTIGSAGRWKRKKRSWKQPGERLLTAFWEALTEWAGKKQYAEALSFVMDYRHAHHAPVKKRARLEL